MLVVGMAVVFAGYTVGSYGWVLLKGWDIPFRSWISPLSTYTWPAGGAEPPPIPATQLFPSSAAASGGTAADSTGTGSSQPGAATQPKPGASGAFGTVPIRTQ
jgi:hypothetical protein